MIFNQAALLILPYLLVSANAEGAQRHPECEEIVATISGGGTSYSILRGTPYPGNVPTFWEAKGICDENNPEACICDDNNPNSWEFGTCQVGSFGGDLDADYMSGEYSAFQPLTSVTFTELPAPKTGTPDHFIAKGVGWLYTSLCNRLKGGENADEKEWVRFNAASLQTQTNPAICDASVESAAKGDFSDLYTCIKGQFGSNVYSMDVEGSDGACEGYWITLTLNYKSYFNPNTQDAGCHPDNCSYQGQVCKLKPSEGDGTNDDGEAMDTTASSEEETSKMESATSTGGGRRLEMATRAVSLLFRLFGI